MSWLNLQLLRSNKNKIQFLLTSIHSVVITSMIEADPDFVRHIRFAMFTFVSTSNLEADVDLVSNTTGHHAILVLSTALLFVVFEFL